MKSRANTPIRLIWMHSHFLYWMGGTKYVFEVMKRMKDSFDLTVVVENASEQARAKYQELGVELVSMEKSTSTSVLYWLTLPWQLRNEVEFVRKIVEEKERKNKKVVLGSNMFPMNVIAYRLGRPHVQYIFEPFAFFHDPEFIAKFPVGKRLFVKLLKLLYAPMDVEATKSANMVLTLNRTIAQYIKVLYGKESVICYTGIDTKHFKPYVSAEVVKKYKGKDILIHSTDYSPVKGTDRMLRIFAEVKKILPKAHLLITSTINDVSMESELKQMTKDLGIEKSVEFLGFVDYDVLPQLYSLAKVLVQCSYSEKSGTTSMALPVKEALACGTKAIRYPIEGEDVVDGVTGFLVDPRDEKKMVEKIVEAVKTDRKVYEAGSKKGREFVVRKYTWENTSTIIAKAVKTVAQGKV